MKKTLFSKGIYAESLRRLRVFGFIALAAMLILQLAPLIISVFEFYSVQNLQLDQEIIGGDYPMNTPEVVSIGYVLISTPFISAIVPPIMVLVLFSVFNKRSSSDFYHSLPYTRTCIFISAMAAVATWVVGICLICSAVGLIGYSIFPNIFSVVYDGLWELLLSDLALFLVTAGGTAIAMGVTGTTLSNVCVTALVLFLPRFIITIMTSWIADSAAFLAFNEVGNSFFSYDINVLCGIVAGLLYFGESPNLFANYAADIYTIILGLIYIAIAAVVFVKRKSETATCPSPGRAAQHVIRIMLTMVVGIFSTILFIEGEWAGFVIVSLVAAIVYFAYELITTHRFKNLLRALPFFGVVVGLCILCGALIIGVPRISANYTPDAEDIDSVRFMSLDTSYYSKWFGAEAQKLDLTDPEIIEVVSENIKENMSFYKEQGYLNQHHYNDETVENIYSSYYEPTEPAVIHTVAIKQGAVTRYRTVFFDAEDFSKILNALEKNEEYVKSCKTLPKPARGSIDIGFYNDEVDYSYNEKVFECLQNEIKTLSFEEWYNVASGMASHFSEFNLWYYTDAYDSSHVSIPISSDVFPKTFEMLIKAVNLNVEESLEDIDMMVNDDEFAENDDYWYASFTVTVKTTDAVGASKYYSAEVYEKQYWANNVYRDAFKDMLAKIEATDKKPDSDEYILVTYQFDSEDDCAYGEVYLPLSDDFDPAYWDFEENIISSQVYKYY